MSEQSFYHGRIFPFRQLFKGKTPFNTSHGPKGVSMNLNYVLNF